MTQHPLTTTLAIQSLAPHWLVSGDLRHWVRGRSARRKNEL